jgi:hypothetical protein
MRLRQVTIENFKRFEHLDVDLRPLDCLVSSFSKWSPRAVVPLRFSPSPSAITTRPLQTQKVLFSLE